MKKHWVKSPLNEKYSGALSFIKNYCLKSVVKSATVEISAIGLYELHINNQKVGNRVLTPGFTSYDKRGVQYQEYDITKYLSQENLINIVAAPGWAVGRFGFVGNDCLYADHISVCARFSITYTDGSTDVFYTDESWDVYTNQIVFADVYDGETIDKTHTPKLLGSAVLDNVKIKIVEDIGEPICEQERLKANLIITPKGEKLLDFGQNMTGYVSLKISGKKGKRVKLSFGEVLDIDGNFYNENYRSAKNEITYILSGEKDYFKPKFSFQGFRYVRVDEYPTEEIDVDGFTAIVVHSDIKRIGNFVCGNKKINQLYHNIIWGQKSNYLDIPTDCPQRDERMGWTGDAQVFCRTAGSNFNVLRFFDKWLADLRAEQTEEGIIYGTCPETEGTTFRAHTRISAAWGDACTIIPWTMYKLYGDKKILSDNFSMMCRWVDYIHSSGSEEYLWLDGWHFGDWLALDAGPDSNKGITSPDLIASAFFAYSTQLVVKTGEVLGEDVSSYKKLYQNIKKAFREKYLEDILAYELDIKSGFDVLDGKISQTAMSLILQFDLCEECEKRQIVDNLVKLIDYYGGKMSTGFVGTPYIMHALSSNGRVDAAYKLLFNEESPSWLYSVNKGATTMWEHWNGIKEDGSFWSKDMNSFNHYAYGAVGDWLYGVSAGIKVDEAGYKKVTLAPIPDERLGYVDASIITSCGKLESQWKYENGEIKFRFVVPKGVTANIILPNGVTKTVYDGEYLF